MGLSKNSPIKQTAESGLSTRSVDKLRRIWRSLLKQKSNHASD
jgi:hypothetical protein